MSGRIVITGIGLISPIGNSKQDFWKNLAEGRPNFRPATIFDTTDLKVNLAGEAQFNPKDILKGTNLMDLDRAALLLASAAKLAITDANIEITEENTYDTGVSVGTTFGSLFSISEFDKESIKDGPRLANPSVFPSTTGNSPASRVSIIFKIKGFNSTISTGMCAASDAIDYACDFLRLGRAKTIIAAAVEALCPQLYLGFYKLNYLAGLKGPLVSCPFDKRRNGIILSEGSVALILETLESAQERKAEIYAEILGIGSSFDYSRFYNYSPKARGMRQAMKAALKNANINGRDIDCIFANANSTIEADLFETNAIKEVFGDYAYKIPVTAAKSVLGETYSASGGMGLAAAVGALNKELIPATANLKEKDPECDLDYVANLARIKKINRVMINSFGPNGSNTSLIIGRVK